jgi:hypothetical protein
MRKSEFKKQAETFFKKNYSGQETKYFRIYSAFATRWVESADPIIEDAEMFFSENEAIEYAKSLSLEVGFSAVIETIIFEYEDLNESFDFGEEFELDDLNFKTINSFDPQGENTIASNKGRSLDGCLLIEWSWERYPGYARNLLNIGFAGEYPFYDFKNEVDLISGNEDRTFRSNYNILLTKEEVAGTDPKYLEHFIHEELDKAHWKWTGAGADSNFISDQISEVVESI